HGVVALEPLDVDDVPPLAHGDDCAVGTTARRVYSQDDRRAHVLVLRPAHGVVHECQADELVVAGRWKLTVDLDARLAAVLTVLGDDLFVDHLVGALDRARVDVARGPDVPLTVETLVEIPGVAPRVAER
ncbi:MAG: hypothetical protein AN487_24085, partial [Anabaena sp. CRKS33]